MNAQDYISSGLLEAYVLGSLSLSESEQVAGAMCRFPEVAAEIAALETFIIQAAESEAVPPPAGYEDKIWAAIQASGAERSTITIPPPSVSPTAAAPQDKPATKVIPLDSRRAPRNTASWARAAVWLLLAGSAVGNYMLWNSGNNSRQQVVALQQQVDVLGQQQQSLTASLNRYKEEAAMAAEPGMQPVAMLSTQAGHPMAATMYWNKAKSMAYVSVQKLPPPPSGMQYQLWAIAGGKPVSLGMIDNEVAVSGGMQKVLFAVTDGQAFAVSLEKVGGSPTPTADKIYLLGKMPA